LKIHRARYDAPNDPVKAAEQVGGLLKAADAAVAETLYAGRGGGGEAEKQRRFSQRISSPTPEEGWNTMADPRHEYEHHLRERAYLLWEREGRPEGHAHEFWERACQEEARAA
jgi:hypothetical protein